MASSVQCWEQNNIDDLPREILERIFDSLPLDSKLSCGLVCRRWMSVLKDAFYHLTDVLLCFEDGYCQISSVVRMQQGSHANDHAGVVKRRRSTFRDEECCSGVLAVNLCACPEHILSHRHSFRIILMAAGRSVKRLIVEDYLLGKGCFVDGGLLEMFTKRCPRLSAVELHHVDMCRLSEQDITHIFPSSRLNEIFFDQCVWTGWTEAAMNRAVKSIVLRASDLREIHLTACPLLNDRTVQFIAKNCLWLWYVDFSGCRSITAKGLSHFFYFMQQRQTDMLYIKIHNTRIDGNELQYYLYGEPAGRAPLHHRSPGTDTGMWAVCNFLMETGHRACSFQNRFIPGKTVVVFM